MTSMARVSLRAESAEAKTKTEPQRVLAIDYGRKRIGLALSDELGLTAQPLTTIVRSNRRDDLKRLREICANYEVARIIVGHPVHITGEASEMASEAARFAARVEKTIGIKTELVDERLTSWEAKQTMTETKSRSRKKNESIDAIAAAVLLRDYLEHQSQPEKKRVKHEDQE